ncbi:MAG: hypothetical protein A4S09_08275 [Proteobacteria bacterium SG_bin7]|nr:MAG: hypothetical protein A4S09_08275 [Proteobacteria bacterium SG_bin7]
MNLQKFVFHFVFLFSLQSFSAVRENNFLILPEQNLLGGLNEEQFHRVISSFEKKIAPIVKAQGGELIVDRLWNNPTVNAFAYSMLGKWTINLYGGYARHPAMTEELLLMSLCHEAGHFMGGHPKKFFSGRSYEGQADYYSTLICMKEMWRNEDNQIAIAGKAADPTVKEKCRGNALCERISMLSLAMARFDALFGDGPSPDFSTPEKMQVKKTNSGYPSPQCRLDTYFAGVLNNPRPRCWYFD